MCEAICGAKIFFRCYHDTYIYIISNFLIYVFFSLVMDRLVLNSPLKLKSGKTFLWEMFLFCENLCFFDMLSVGAISWSCIELPPEIEVWKNDFMRNVFILWKIFFSDMKYFRFCDKTFFHLAKKNFQFPISNLLESPQKSRKSPAPDISTDISTDIGSKYIFNFHEVSFHLRFFLSGYL